jgi:hypothetical protein
MGTPSTRQTYDVANYTTPALEGEAGDVLSEQDNFAQGGQGRAGVAFALAMIEAPLQ